MPPSQPQLQMQSYNNSLESQLRFGKSAYNADSSLMRFPAEIRQIIMRLINDMQENSSSHIPQLNPIAPLHVCSVLREESLLVFVRGSRFHFSSLWVAQYVGAPRQNLLIAPDPFMGHGASLNGPDYVKHGGFGPLKKRSTLPGIPANELVQIGGPLELNQIRLHNMQLSQITRHVQVLLDIPCLGTGHYRNGLRRFHPTSSASLVTVEIGWRVWRHECSRRTSASHSQEKMLQDWINPLLSLHDHGYTNIRTLRIQLGPGIQHSVGGPHPINHQTLQRDPAINPVRNNTLRTIVEYLTRLMPYRLQHLEVCGVDRNASRFIEDKVRTGLEKAQ